MTDRPIDDGHERHGDSVAAYLLGALPELEAQAFERHLLGCSQCRDELELLRPAVDALPQSAMPVRAPAALRESLMQSVRAEAKAARPSAPRRRWFPRPGLGPRPVLAWASGAVIACAGLAAGFGAAALLGDGARVYTASVGEATPRASASLEMDGDDDPGAVVSVSGMPTLPSERDASVYQLWLVRGEEGPAPSAIFSVDDAGAGRGAITESMRGVDSVLVTREPPGGSRVPSEEPIISFDLS
jgi:hypothetical protein